MILLDEPTAGMSRSETAAAVALVKEVTQGKTLLMVEHDMSVVFGLADRISVVVYGQIIASGTPAEIRANAQVKEAYLGQQPMPPERREPGVVPARGGTQPACGRAQDAGCRLREHDKLEPQ